MGNISDFQVFNPSFFRKMKKKSLIVGFFFISMGKVLVLRN